MKKVWCVRHRDGWCAVRGNFEFPEEITSVETVCLHFVTLPGGCEKRLPDCQQCLTHLKEQHS